MQHSKISLFEKQMLSYLIAKNLLDDDTEGKSNDFFRMGHFCYFKVISVQNRYIISVTHHFLSLTAQSCSSLLITTVIVIFYVLHIQISDLIKVHWHGKVFFSHLHRWTCFRGFLYEGTDWERELHTYLKGFLDLEFFLHCFFFFSLTWNISCLLCLSHWLDSYIFIWSSLESRWRWKASRKLANVESAHIGNIYVCESVCKARRW